MKDFDIYETITNKIIAQLEEAEKNGSKLPWQKGWIRPQFTTKKIKVKADNDCCYNGATGRIYSFLNQMLLLKAGAYASFDQIQSMGGKVKKGEKGSFVVFWKLYKKTEKNAEGEEVEKIIPVLKYYTVFHIETQTEGVDEKKIKTPYREAFEAIETEQVWDNLEECEKLSTMYLEREGIHFSEEAGDRAFYRPMMDSITLPKRSQFKDASEWYATLWHEMGHSTGHEKRLNRLSVDARFGDEKYANEELVAEICSSSMCNIMGIENGSTFKNTVAYIHSWIQALKNDKKLIVTAASKAEKAVQYIFDGKTERVEEG